MKTVRVVYHNLDNKKKVANFKILENDKLEIINIVDYVSPILNEKKYVEQINNNNENIKKLINKVGIGDLFASFTKLFGFKPCAPCDRRRKYLNKITPNWLSKIITKAYT